MIACRPGVSICNKTVSKTFGRYTAENSLISAMALLCVVASTHFWPTTLIDCDLYRDAKATYDGVKLWFDLVSKVYHNAPICLVYPDLGFPQMIQCNIYLKGKVNIRRHLR